MPGGRLHQASARSPRTFRRHVGVVADRLPPRATPGRRQSTGSRCATVMAWARRPGDGRVSRRQRRGPGLASRSVLERSGGRHDARGDVARRRVGRTTRTRRRRSTPRSSASRCARTRRSMSSAATAGSRSGRPASPTFNMILSRPGPPAVDPEAAGADARARRPRARWAAASSAPRSCSSCSWASRSGVTCSRDAPQGPADLGSFLALVLAMSLLARPARW